MKKLSYLLFLSAILLGCELLQQDDTGADTDSSYNGMDVIGKGYDVFKEYADPEEVKLAILDVEN